MENRGVNGVNYGPWLVGLGAALWGTESAWRIPLNELFDAQVIVFWEHVLILLMFLPLLISRVGEIRKIDARTWGYLALSGFAGSAVGTVFFTLALKYGNATVVNVVLNIQPVISTIGAFLFFGDRLGPRFFLYAGMAIVAGVFVSVAHPTLIAVSFERAGLNRGTGYALICALFWGLATVAGRGVMTGMSLRLASSLRIVVGTYLHDADSPRLRQAPWRGALAGARAGTRHKGDDLAGSARLHLWGIPFLVYFEGLRLTRASTAGYFEMMQTLAAVCITWGFFRATLEPHQVFSGLVLIAAVAMVHRVQQRTEQSETRR